MAYSDLWSQTHYLAPYNYILDSNIVEYDIEKANINILRSYGAIPQYAYDKTAPLPKWRREVVIGKMMRREPKLVDILKQGIQDARRQLFELLNLDSNNVLSIKNDAIFVIFMGPASMEDIRLNDFITFKAKGHFRSFYYLGEKELYYTYDPMSGTEGMDIKGMGNRAIKECDGFIKSLSDIFYMCLTGGVKAAYDMSTKFYEDYMNKKFPANYYRRFDSWAKFDLLPISQYASFRADFLPDNAVNLIDPSYNLAIIRELISYYADVLLKMR